MQKLEEGEGQKKPGKELIASYMFDEMREGSVNTETGVWGNGHVGGGL